MTVSVVFVSEGAVQLQLVRMALPGNPSNRS